MMKRIFALLLTVLMVLGALGGCGNTPAANDTTSPATTEADEPKQFLKVLTLGHSLAVDANHMLALVAAAEGYDGLEVGTLYYSGCPLWRHVEYIKNDERAYDLYYSKSSSAANPPQIISDVSMKDALVYRDWDLIVMQGGTFELAEADKFTDGNIQTIQEYVNEHKLNKNAVFAWHMPWAFATDPSLQEVYVKQTGAATNVYTEGYKAYNNDRLVFYNKTCENVENYILTDDTFKLMIPTGTAMENAMSSYLTEKELIRDYAHANDYGRLIAAYTWYCKLANVEQLDDIKLTTIPKNFLKTYTGAGDMTLTETEKAILIESVNNALKQPLQQTQSQFAEAPTA
ncbi:MAG: DUF4886 domain-containing protein [Oscillospiraceae bacterium]|nr:DUF4886 domain-containing protein [Oscillospiraceae bacterium]